MIRTIRYGNRVIEYTLICARNRTRILLQALPENRIRVYAPTGVKLRDMDKLVTERITEIDAAHKKLSLSERHESYELMTEITVEGILRKLIITRSSKNRIVLTESELNVYTIYSDTKKIKEQIKCYLVEFSLKRLRSYLEKWSSTINKTYNRVTVREQKTRWGSCSSKSNLNFNWKLIIAPPQAFEYVVIHELCHLLYFNHSSQFWNEVRSRMPEYDVWKKWLKAHGHELSI